MSQGFIKYKIENCFIMKKILIMISMLFILMSTTFASENASFFGGNPTISNWDGATGTGTIDFSVDTNNANTIRATILIGKMSEGYQQVYQVGGFGARDSVQHSFDIPNDSIGSGKMGDYYMYIELHNEDDFNEFDSTSYFEGLIGDFTGGNPLEDIYYLYGTPAPTGLDQNAGTFSLDYYIGSDTGLSDITTEVEFIHDEAGVLISETFINQGHNSYSSPNMWDITTLGNYNGDYEVRVYSYSEGNPSLNSEAIIPVFTYSNGIAYVATIEGCTNSEATNYNPSANSDDGSCVLVTPSGFAGLTEIIISMFGVLGTMIAGVVVLITGDLLVLAIVGSVIAFIIGIVYLLKTHIQSTLKVNK